MYYEAGHGISLFNIHGMFSKIAYCAWAVVYKPTNGSTGLPDCVTCHFAHSHWIIAQYYSIGANDNNHGSSCATMVGEVIKINRRRIPRNSAVLPQTTLKVKGLGILRNSAAVLLVCSHSQVTATPQNYRKTHYRGIPRNSAAALF